MTKTSAINRIHELLDDNSFVEVGAYITARSTDYNMQSQETPADGVVTGYGTINGALVYVYSQDASVMGGSIGEMHAKKIEKLYSMAMKMGAPIVAPGRLCRIQTPGKHGCPGRFRQTLCLPGNGIRCDPADPGCVWKLRRWNGCGI